MFQIDPPNSITTHATKVMETVEGWFGWKTWYEEQLNAMCLFFSTRGRCDRFIAVCIHRNVQDWVPLFLSCACCLGVGSANIIVASVSAVRVY